MTKWKLHRRHLLQTEVYDGCLRRSSCAIICVASRTSCLFYFMEHHFCLRKQLTNYGYSNLGSWQAISWKWTKWACLSKENNRLLVANDEKIPGFRRNLEFWKTFVIMSMTASHYFRTFLMGSMVVLVYVIFGYWIMCNVSTFGKLEFTQWINVFQMANAWCYKIIDFLNARQAMDFNLTIWKVYKQGFRFHSATIKKLPLRKFWYSIKEAYPQFS